jgi:DNA-binding NtrC family response regulator
MPFAPAVVERTMKVQEVLMQAISGQLTWLQAEDILGWQPRTLRRWRLRYQQRGYDGLWDRRRQQPSPRCAPVAEVARITRLYREQYPGFNAAHFREFIESELFGHKKGAFTGAAEHRTGWLEVCPPLGTVFLDEIGETEAAVQVKLLRVLQTRTFQRVGDTQDRPFQGKIVAATNRSLAEAMQAGRFRSDLYYRLCSDVIETPSLAAQLRDAPEELGHLLRFLGRRIAGDEEAEAVAQETEAWITKHLGADYPWPGNVRELEQCLRNVMIRGRYSPPRPASAGVREELASAFLGGAWTVEETVRRHCTLVFAQTGNYQETARRLGIDWRTVKEKVDRALLGQLTGHDVARREKT